MTIQGFVKVSVMAVELGIGTELCVQIANRAVGVERWISCGADLLNFHEQEMTRARFAYLYKCGLLGKEAGR